MGPGTGGLPNGRYEESRRRRTVGNVLGWTATICGTFFVVGVTVGVWFLDPVGGALFTAMVVGTGCLVLREMLGY
jgi:hypothetical protein